jgi:membrane fusion protein (multidrug efflux system)
MKLSTALAGISVFVFLGLLGGGLFLHKRSQIIAAMNAPPMPEFPEWVRLGEARETEWQPTAELVGTAFSMRSVRISNELAGVVKRIGFESGSIVDEGEVLLELDAATEEADLAAAEAAVRVAEAQRDVGRSQRDLAETELRRVRDASTQNAATPIELERREAEFRTAEADVARLEAEVDQAGSRVAQAKTRLAKFTIKAPFRGRAGIRTIHEGQYLAEGTVVVALEEIADTIYLDFPIPQEYLARVRPGLTVKAESAVLGTEPVSIEVVAIDAIVNNATRNVRVRGVVANPEGRIRPGMFVQVRVPVEPPSKKTMVPATAVRRATFGDHVFVVVPSANPADPPGSLRASMRPVVLGPTVGNDVIVLEGLQPGERIATTGSFKLREGALVGDVDNRPPADATASR